MTAWQTTADVARALGFTEKTIRSWCVRGIFPGAIKFPDNSPRSEWRIPSGDVEARKRRVTDPRTIPRDRIDQLMDDVLAKTA